MQSSKSHLNHHLPFNPRGLGAADKSRVVVSHLERKAGARGVEAVLALDGQRQLGLVAGQAQRQQQLDPAVVELCTRHHVLEASELERRPIACGVGRITAPDRHERAVQAFDGRGHDFERSSIIEHQRRERIHTPRRERHHEFSKSLSALGMSAIVDRMASSIKAMLSRSSGKVRGAFGAIGSVASTVQLSKVMLSG